MARHWSEDPYWIEASNDISAILDSRQNLLCLDLEVIADAIYNGDGPAYKLMDGMLSVNEHEGMDGFRGAPRLLLACLAALSKLKSKKSSKHETATSAESRTQGGVEMATGKSIRVYLPNGSVTGIRYAELVNWTGQAVAAPRNRLQELKASWPEAAKPGVYFLFENRFGDVKPLAYIGESENVMERLMTHDKGKDFWNDVVVFSSKDQNLTKSHIKYLEATFVALAKKADRYDLQNGNSPPESSLPRADRDAMDEFAGNAKMVLGVLGHTILEPLIKKSEADVPAPPTTLASPMLKDSLSDEDLVFKVNGVMAFGRVTDEGFVLRKRSQVSIKNGESLEKRIVKIKSDLMENGSLVHNGTSLIVHEDLLLSSPSYAASLVAGSARNGLQSWKYPNGTTLKQQEENAANLLGSSVG